MSQKTSGGNVRSDWVKGILAAALLCVFGALACQQRFAGDGEDVTEPLQAGIGHQTCEVTCGACNATFTLPAMEYVAQINARSDSAAGIVCVKCGAGAAWQKKGPVLIEDDADPEWEDHENRG